MGLHKLCTSTIEFTVNYPSTGSDPTDREHRPVDRIICVAAPNGMGCPFRISRELDRADFCHARRISVWRRSIFGVGLYAALFPSALDVE
jgi:hypothetical protein